MTFDSKALFAAALFASVTACGGAQQQEESSIPDESRDLTGTQERNVIREERTVATGRTPVGANFVGSRWQFVEASCTEGTPSIASRQFTDELRVESNPDGFLLVHDQTLDNATCKRTVLQSAKRREDGEFDLTEETQVGLPATPECLSPLQATRKGEVRMHGEFLEVLVQRSQLCNGFEVRFVYGPAPRAALTDEQIARRYVSFYNRKDVDRLVRLFADTGTLVESFTINEDNSPTRHDGRDAVRAWFAQSFADVPWVALKLNELTPSSEAGQFDIAWEYMDPRLTTPFTGRNHFTVAASEVFELSFDVTGAPGNAPAAAATNNAATRGNTPANAPAEQPARRGRGRGRAPRAQ